MASTEFQTRRLNSDTTDFEETWLNPGYLHRISGAVLRIINEPPNVGNINRDQNRQLQAALGLLEGVGSAFILKDRNSHEFCGDANHHRVKAMIQEALVQTFSKTERDHKGRIMRRMISFPLSD